MRAPTTPGNPGMQERSTALKQHTSFMFDRWPRFAFRHPWRALGMALLVFVVITVVASDGIGLGARTARTLVERDPAAAIAPLDYVLELTETAFAEMRALIFELSPDSLAREGLRTALEGQIAALTARHGLPISFAAPAEPELGLPAKEALYRIGIEALHNVVKHARARRVAVTLAEGAGQVSLSVADDGVGFEPEAAFPGHLGLDSMRQRAEAAGGQLRVESRPGSGTTVTATLPGLA